MKTKIVLLLVLSLLLIGCAAGKLSTPITMMGNNKDMYSGRIDHPCYFNIWGDICDANKGILTIENGPNGETFTGNFVVVNRTAMSSTQGGAFVPMGNNAIAVGSVRSESSGRVDMTSYWYATGSKGSTMKCEMKAGGGHGQGICKHSSRAEYEILY